MAKLSETFQRDIEALFEHATKVRDTYSIPQYEHTALASSDVRTEAFEYQKQGNEIRFGSEVVYIRTPNSDIIKLVEVNIPPHDTYKVVTKIQLAFLNKLLTEDSGNWEITESVLSRGTEIEYVLARHKKTGLFLKLIWRKEPLFFVKPVIKQKMEQTEFNLNTESDDSSL